MAPAVLLWDFGDTLVDERWLYEPPETFPTWAEAWTDVMELHADGWNDGSIDRAAVFTAMAERSGLPVADVERHARDCCRRLEPHTTAWRVATQRRLPQALVTVNPDLLGDWIVPDYELEVMFDTIVVSCVERTRDKVTLCTIALDRLGFDGNRSDALLIDNRIDLIEAWRATGGSAYWFRGDAQFGADVTELLASSRGGHRRQS
jgi:hypothetical protein